MTGRFGQDGAALRSGLGKLEYSPLIGDGAPLGVPAEWQEASEESDQETKDETEQAEDTGTKVGEAVDRQEDVAEDGKKNLEGIADDEDGKGGKDRDGDGKPDGPGGKGKDGEPDGTTKPSSDANIPSNQTAQQTPQATPQMPSSSSGSPMPMSSIPQATQADVNNAPNRQEVIDKMKADQEGRTKGELGRDGTDEDKARELAEKYVNAEPPIPYAWGGGHGPEPGASQGTRDGGTADSFGDYAKQGLDCSGFARAFTYDLYGVDAASGTSESQYSSGKPVSASEARAGDLFFPDSAGRPPSHVQVYVGNGQVAEAQKSGTYLKFSPLTSGEWRRMV